MPNRSPRRATGEDLANGQALPLGKTCGDCVYFEQAGYCRRERGVLAADEVCVLTPRRFTEPSINGRAGLLRVSIGDRLKGRGDA